MIYSLSNCNHKIKCDTVKEALDYVLFNETTTRETVEERFPSILMDFANCNILEYEEFYNLLRNWYNEIINSFNIANNKRINNSYIESRNRQIERLLFNANGYTNF